MTKAPMKIFFLGEAKEVVKDVRKITNIQKRDISKENAISRMSELMKKRYTFLSFFFHSNYKDCDTSC